MVPRSKSLSLVLGLGLLLGGLGAASAQVEAVRSSFDCEGILPYAGDRLEFSALASQVLTSGGHGLRNEVKRRVADRRSLFQTKESLAARVSWSLSPGAKTIVVQYHEADASTLFKLMVADIRDPRLVNGKPNDGVFDVYARIEDDQGIERVFPFSAAAGDGSFTFSLAVDRGLITLTVDGTTVVQQGRDSPAVYLKFGDYLQAQDAVTGLQARHEEIPGFYAAHGITVDKVVFENVQYRREE